MIRHKNYKDITYKHYDNVFMSTEKYPDFEELNPEFEKFEISPILQDLDFNYAEEIASSLAFQLGYETCYLDGGNLSNEEYEKAKNDISSIVGENWPESVEEAYSRGCAQGCWDT